MAEPPPREAVTEAVNAFKRADSSSATKLLLAARYDGVDLPGDTCRVMVIDDLPMGSGPLERFLWESLLLSNSLRSALASRIVQSFGRISRGMSDHGVVIITGKRLVEWLLLPKNAAALPGFLQKQIQLGYAVSESADSLDSLMSAANACLSRDRQWVDSYGAFLRDAAEEVAPEDSDAMVTLALSETEFIGALWDRDYDRAANCLSKSLETAFRVSSSTGAWHCLWLGYALERGGDVDSAREMYARAHGVQRNIPGMVKEAVSESGSAVPQQILEVDQQITVRPDGTVKLPKTLHADLALLNGSGSVPQTEEALRCLGQYLGFKSNRPDKEFGTGPDVLWLVDDSTALCMEAKTDKKASGHYQKTEVSQLSDHVQWVRDNTNADYILPALIGPLVPATESANPAPEVLVVELEEFNAVADRLVGALKDVASNSLPLTLRPNLVDAFRSRQLLWFELFDSMSKVYLRDIDP